MQLTLTLNQNWDLSVDDNGNIAVSKDDYAIAQNSANAVRLFTNDAYFDRDKGIPHYNIELGNKAETSRSILANRIQKAVLAVDGVEDAVVDLVYDVVRRTYGGEIILTTKNSTKVSIEL